MSHGNVSSASADRRRLAAVLALSLVILAIEAAGSLATNSLALLADAGHVLADAGGIALALFAIWMASRPADRSRTFGYHRLEILAAIADAVLLLGIAGFVLFEAWGRVGAAEQVASGPMLAFALVALAINGAGAFLLRDAQRRSLSMRAAYLEVIGDLAGSAAVVVAAAVIAATGWTPADILASVAIACLILPRTFTLIRDATDVLLEATPKGLDMDLVRSHILEAPGVTDVHDLHAWTITSGVDVVSAHVVLAEDADPPAVLDHLCACLSDTFDIEHSTFQLETRDRRRLEEAAHL